MSDTVNQNSETTPEGKTTKSINPGIIAAIAALIIVAVVAVLVVFSPSGSESANQSQGFGDINAASKIKLQSVGSSTEQPVLDLSSLQGLEKVTTLSGYIIHDGDEGEPLAEGLQANISEIYYAQGGATGASEDWDVAESGWGEDTKPLPIKAASEETPTAPAATPSSGSTPFVTLVSEKTGTSDASSTSTGPDFEGLLKGHKAGTILAVISPASKSAAQGSSPAFVALLIIRKVVPIGQVDVTPVSTDAPSNAPVIDYSVANPTIQIPSDFKGTDDIVVKVLEEGTGAVIATTDTVTVDYSGWLLNGTKFDSSFDRNETASFALNSVIKGWTSGISGQKVGSKLELLVPSKYGYGTRGSGQTIPPDSFLVFYVDIKSAIDADTAAAQEQADPSAGQGTSPTDQG